MEQRRVAGHDDGVLLAQHDLVGLQAAPEGEEIRVFVQSIGQNPDGLGFTFTPYLVGLPVGLRQDDLPVTVGHRANLQVLFLPFGPEPGGDAVTLGPHAGINAGGDRVGEIGPFQPHVQNFYAEILLLHPALDPFQHFVKDISAGIPPHKQGKALGVLHRIAKLIQYGFRADNLKPVSQRDPVAQGRGDNVPQTAAGVDFCLQGLAELDRVDNPVPCVGVDNQVLLFLVRHGHWGGVDPQDALVQGDGHIDKGGFEFQARCGGHRNNFTEPENYDLLGLVDYVNGLKPHDQTNNYHYYENNYSFHSRLSIKLLGALNLRGGPNGHRCQVAVTTQDQHRFGPGRDDYLGDPGQYLFHSFQVEPLPGNFLRISVFGQH